ncbi:MAG: CHRD domain-containing protein [Gemmatimonadaceae bacterium]
MPPHTSAQFHDTDFDDELVTIFRLALVNQTRIGVALLLVAATVTPACGSDEKTGTGVLDSGGPATIALTAPRDTLIASGDTRAVLAVVKNSSGTVLSPTSLVWTSSAPNVATVLATNDGAIVTAVGDGTTSITASAPPRASSTVAVTVKRRIATLSITAPTTSVVYGTTTQLTAVALDSHLKPIVDGVALTFSSSDPGTISVSPSGLATPIFSFLTNVPITVTASAALNGAAVSNSIEMKASPPSVFDEAALMLSEYVKPIAAATPGYGVAYFAVVGNSINYTVTWSLLSAKATSVQLHGAGTSTDVSGMLVEFAIPTSTTNFGTVNGSFTASDIRVQGGQPAISLDSLVKLLNTGNAYIDVRTAAYPSGEIRGQSVHVAH